MKIRRRAHPINPWKSSARSTAGVAKRLHTSPRMNSRTVEVWNSSREPIHSDYHEMNGVAIVCRKHTAKYDTEKKVWRS